MRCFVNSYRLAVTCTIVVFLGALQSFGQVEAKIENVNGNPSLVINGQEYPPFAYMSYLGEEEFYREIAHSDIHLYNFPAYIGERGINSTSGIGPFRAPIWIGENQYDFSSLVKDFEKIIRSDRDAKVIIRFYLDPPLWYEKKYPEASALLKDGSTFRQCFNSDKWRADTGKVLKDCIEWLLKSPYKDNLAGIHVASGFTEEWFYHPGQYQDINPERTVKFRQWLQNYYNDEQALRRHWNNPTVTFKTAKLANIDESKSRNEWRSLEFEQNYVDTYRFRAETMVDNIAYFCKLVKEVSNDNLLTGAFYGYHYFVSDPRRGHGALAKLLDCPNLDYLSSPNSYNRSIGEDWPPMAAVQSVQLHGKLWLAENDTRTSITTLLKDRSTGVAPEGQYENGVWLGPDDMKTSVSLLWKNTARMLTHGYGGWWFDMWGGWFSDPELLNVLKKTQSLYLNSDIEIEHISNEVCVLVDEELSFWDASYGHLTNQIITNRYSLAKSGAPYDLYLLTDLNNITTDDYKVVWFMGVIDLSREVEEKIAYLREQGKTVLWTSSKGTKIYRGTDNESFVQDKFKWTNSELREIWNNASVHQYIETEDIFYIGRNWLSIHTVDGGKRKISFPFHSKIEDPISKKVLADSTKLIELQLAPKSTTLLRWKSLTK